jgi:hypothetical protein
VILLDNSKEKRVIKTRMGVALLFVKDMRYMCANCKLLRGKSWFGLGSKYKCRLGFGFKLSVSDTLYGHCGWYEPKN